MASIPKTLNDLVIFLSTIPSKRGLKPVCQSSFDSFDGTVKNLAFSTHKCEDSPRWLQTHFSCNLTHKLTFGSQGQVEKWPILKVAYFLHSAIRWPDLQSTLSVLSWWFFFPLLVLVRQNALYMCCMRETDKPTVRSVCWHCWLFDFALALTSTLLFPPVATVSWRLIKNADKEQSPAISKIIYCPPATLQKLQISLWKWSWGEPVTWSFEG